MTTATITHNQDAVITEIQIAAPAERVFQALTRGDALMRWFTNESCPARVWEMDARVGGLYRHVTAESATAIVVNGVNQFECHGEILEYDPPRLLVYTWIANWHADKSLRTVVRWELTPHERGTLVKVTHSGLANEEVARDDYSGGWLGVVEMLKKFVEL
jgi:uncharacterized protein YndB with AHSA1/START domain